LGRIRKRAQLDTRLHARLERSPGDAAGVAPSEQLAELFLGISAYTGRSTGAVRRGANGSWSENKCRRIVIGL
jgi:hypothetical protein